MTTSFLAISSMSGIACASDTDHTLYKLSNKQPLAIAVNSFSPIPWDRIINLYKEKGEPECKMNFEDYALEFIDYLSSYPLTKSWKHLSQDDTNIIFMGYGQEDLFPCVYEVTLEYNEQENRLETKEHLYTQISHKNKVSINQLGDFQAVSTLLSGCNNETQEFLLRKYVELYQIYKQRVLEKFKGTEFESFVVKELDVYDPDERFADIMNKVSNRVFRHVQHGIDTFSIEEMVTAVETIVNANVRLNHLSFGCKEPLHTTREIAVITRAEGVTWIKHSLYAL